MTTRHIDHPAYNYWKRKAATPEQLIEWADVIKEIEEDKEQDMVIGILTHGSWNAWVQHGIDSVSNGE
jgi:hypothetical protein